MTGLHPEDHIRFLGGKGKSGTVKGEHHPGRPPYPGGLGKGHVHVKECGSFLLESRRPEVWRQMGDVGDPPGLSPSAWRPPLCPPNQRQAWLALQTPNPETTVERVDYQTKPFKCKMVLTESQNCQKTFREIKFYWTQLQAVNPKRSASFVIRRIFLYTQNVPWTFKRIPSGD